MQETAYKFVKWTLWALASGIGSGLSATIFLFGLQWATDFRDGHTVIIWLLPIAGLLIAWLYQRFDSQGVFGPNLILDEIHNPQRKIPFRMSPLILLSTILTHLFGGSAGREGTAVQMGASFADHIAHLFQVAPNERKALLMAGTGSGFGAAIGTPLAGFIFGWEVLYVRFGRYPYLAVWMSLVSSGSALLTSHVLHAPHTEFNAVVVTHFSIQTAVLVFGFGLMSGLVARTFMQLTHMIEHLHRSFVPNTLLRPFFGGLAFLILFICVNQSARYVGLGLPIIQDSLSGFSDVMDPFWKALFTSVTIGSGFKGGEFIPLVFIGATFGNVVAKVLSLNTSLFAAMGFSAVFAGAANTPIACAVMGAEIFGWSVLPYSALACLGSFLTSGNKGIYKTQRSGKLFTGT